MNPLSVIALYLIPGLMLVQMVIRDFLRYMRDYTVMGVVKAVGLLLLCWPLPVYWIVSARLRRR